MTLVVGLGAALAVVGIAAPASAATLTVTSSADSGAGSLREIIAVSSPNDIITFAPALTTIALESSIVLSWGLTIMGPGAGGLTITRGSINDFDQFSFEPNIADQDLTISGMTIEGIPGGTGRAVSVTGGGGLPRNVTLSGLAIRDETGTNAGGGVWIDNGVGNIVIEDSTFTASTASGGGALFVFDYPTLAIRDSAFTGNAAGGGGGAIAVGSVLETTIADSSFTSNSAATTFGGAVVLDGGCDTLSVTGSTFTSNSAGDSGGAIYAQDLNGASSITGSSFIDNSAADGTGGAVSIARIRGTFEILTSTFNGNSATDDAAFSGGAVAVGQLTNIGAMRVDSSTFSGNSATGSPSFGISLGITQAEGDLTISSSTFNESGATESYAISLNVFNAGAETSIEFSTIAGPGGVQIQQNPGSAELVSSIVDGGAFPAVRVPFGGNAVATSWSLLSSQLFLSDTSDGGNNTFSVADMNLGPLQNNGGATQTRLPLPTSPAFNTGDPAFVSPPTFDQRGTGYDRVALGRIDIGAVEGEFALAATGAKINPWVLAAGALLVVLGIGAVVFGRIRRARRYSGR